jgi:hypothetical protein
LAAITANVYLSLTQAFEAFQAVFEQLEQQAKQIGTAIEAVQKSFSIPAIRFAPELQDMIDASRGSRWRACERLAKEFPFQIPASLNATLKRKKLTKDALVARCIFEITQRSQSMPICKFDDGQTGPFVALDDLTIGEAYKWLISEVYYASMTVIHAEKYLPRVRVCHLPILNEAGIWINDLEIWTPTKVHQLPSPLPKKKRGQPDKLEQRTSPEIYQQWCAKRWLDVLSYDDPPPSDKWFAQLHDVSTKSVQNWRKDHDLPPPRDLRIQPI